MVEQRWATVAVTWSKTLSGVRENLLLFLPAEMGIPSGEDCNTERKRKLNWWSSHYVATTITGNRALCGFLLIDFPYSNQSLEHSCIFLLAALYLSPFCHAEITTGKSQKLQVCPLCLTALKLSVKKCKEIFS